MWMSPARKVTKINALFLREHPAPASFDSELLNAAFEGGYTDIFATGGSKTSGTRRNLSLPLADVGVLTC